MPKEKRTIFYAWQSDKPKGLNRYFIEDALKEVLTALNNDPINPFDLHLDKDTLNLSGSPDIFNAILKKIDAAAVFIADVSIIGRVGRTTKKPVSNPNVMLELGYALKSLTTERYIIIANTAFGPIDKLPFDTKGKRVLDYHLSEKDSVSTKKYQKETIKTALREAIWAILTLPQRNIEASPKERFHAGVTLVAQHAATAFGPNGKRFISGNLSTRDGMRITGHLHHDDNKVNEGILLMSTVPSEIREYCGDGSKLATILCSSMVDQLLPFSGRNIEIQDVFNVGEVIKEAVLEYIRDSALPMSDTAVFGIALTASDKNSANILTEAYLAKDIEDSALLLEPRHEPGITTLSVEDGFKIESGYFSEDFGNDPETGKCVLRDSLVLIVDGEINSRHQLLPILEKVAKAKKPLLIIAKGFSAEIIGMLVINNERGIIQSVAVKEPGSDQNRADRLKDLAVVVGSKVFGTVQSGLLENADLSGLGEARTIVISSGTTIIQDARGDVDKVSIRLQQIKQQIAQSDSPYEREKLKARYSEMIGRKQIITVRTRVPSELQEKTYLMTTAMRSIESSRVSGYVSGGGLVLYAAGRHVMSKFATNPATELEKEVALAFSKALFAPMALLLKRASVGFTDLEAAAGENPLIGLDAKKRKFTNLIDSEIIDSAEMVAAAVQAAYYHARTIVQLA